MDGQTDRRTDRRMDGQTEGEREDRIEESENRTTTTTTTRPVGRCYWAVKANGEGGLLGSHMLAIRDNATPL